MLNGTPFGDVQGPSTLIFPGGSHPGWSPSCSSTESSSGCSDNTKKVWTRPGVRIVGDL